jgi:hypothetical protein
MGRENQDLDPVFRDGIRNFSGQSSPGTISLGAIQQRIPAVSRLAQMPSARFDVYILNYNP